MRTKLRSREPMKIARQYAAERYPCEVEGHPTFWYINGMFWVWYGGRWEVRTTKEVELDLAVWLEDAYVGIGEDGEPRRFVVRPYKVEEIMYGLEATTVLPYKQTPTWHQNDVGWDPRWCIAFRDKVVHVREDGGLEAIDRDPSWLDVAFVDCEWDPTAQAPTWEGCLKAWGAGDPLWAELAERWRGYCMVGYREYGRFLHPFGPARSGKTTYCTVGKWLVGDLGIMEKLFENLMRDFDLLGIHDARELQVPEIAKLSNKDAAQLEGFLKSLVGRNAITARRKYKDPVVALSNAAVTLVGNDLLHLPDSNLGITSKMLLLPFKQRFVGKEDFGLGDRLKGELAGLARRCLEAAGRLRVAGSAEKWPLPQTAKEIVDRQKARIHIAHGFLENMFVEREGSFVSYPIIWGHWLEYQKGLGEKAGLSKRELFDWLELNSGWQVKRAEMDGGVGLSGMALRRNFKDLF